jgi:PAS domain S-box-containing protein
VSNELERFFDLSLDLLFIAGFDGRLLRVNEAFERTLGYTRDELLARPLISLVHPDDIAKSKPALAALARGEDGIGFEARVVCADGCSRRLQWTTRAVPEHALVFGAARDVTEHRLLADEQAALRRVAVLVARDSPPSEVFAAVVEEAGLLLGVGVATMFRFEGDEATTVVANWGAAGPVIPLGTRLALDGDGIAVRVHRTGAPTRVDDYDEASGEIAARARALGVRGGVGTPIVVGGALWGAMIVVTHEPRPLPASTEARMSEFTELVATAISNTEARAALAASRARLVAATDDERRRVVRDLHDGAQQLLVHTIITLKLARGELAAGADGAPGLVAAALEHAERANAELRELAHGILPAVLSRGGLRASVDELALRMALPVANGATARRFPAAVESTAYFVISEALTNVAKHARASRAWVTAEVGDGALAVEVRDDGSGGARPDGSGLVGLADRLAAIDGRLRVDSPPGGGTVVTATIPLTCRRPGGDPPANGPRDSSVRAAGPVDEGADIRGLD